MQLIIQDERFLKHKLYTKAVLEQNSNKMLMCKHIPQAL